MEPQNLNIIFNIFGFLIVTGLVSWLLSKVYEMDRHLTRALGLQDEKVKKMVEVQAAKIEQNRDRIELIDEALSIVADQPFRSEHVVAGKQKPPSFGALYWLTKKYGEQNES